MISECCYAEDRMVGPDGPDYSDILECPVCHEHAVFIEVDTVEKVRLRKGRIYEIEQILNARTDDERL